MILEDKIILYKKIEIEDNNDYELDKDNLILYVVFQVTDDSFVYDPNSMTFSLISENLSILRSVRNKKVFILVNLI